MHKYNVGDFPIYQMYHGYLHNYIAFLVLRFYDDPDDFKMKLNSLTSTVDVYISKKVIFTKAILYNRVNGIRVEISTLEDPIIVTVKLLHVLLGDDFINQKLALRVLAVITDPETIITPNYISQKFL